MRSTTQVLVLALLAAGCAGGTGPRPIPTGAPCTVCGMSIQDLRYAGERRVDGRFRYYDSIECLNRSRSNSGQVWLADYDTRVLVAAESIWVVRAEIPSPMGGGYAAFRSRAAAEEIARERHGTVARLEEFPAEVAP